MTEEAPAKKSKKGGKKGKKSEVAKLAKVVGKLVKAAERHGVSIWQPSDNHANYGMIVR